MHLQAKEKTREHANTHRQQHTLLAEIYYCKVHLQIPLASFKLSFKEMHKKQFYSLRVAIKNKISRSQREISQILMQKCNFNGKN